ncbi:MAG: DUF1566 domain-containing protein [Proteobacteria bacterium]|nr:DUF1566 domain-containing protein [Pseudomonadota bacterium]
MTEITVGTKMTDGSIYAGLTPDGPDGKRRIFAMPQDLSVTMAFNEAVKAVRKLNAENALGHNDWQLPALENLWVLHKNQEEGALKGTFNKASPNSPSDCRDCYWSATRTDDKTEVYAVSFSENLDDSFRKAGYQMSVRPVRLEPVQ